MNATANRSVGRRRKVAVVTVCAAIIAGVGGWYTWAEWQGMQAPVTAPVVQSTRPDIRKPEATTIVEVVPTPRIPPGIGPIDGIPINIGTVTPEMDSIKRTVTLRHLSGRADPVSMSNPKIDIKTRQGRHTTAPIVLTEDGSCFTESADADTDGTYCSFTIEWTPGREETLEGTFMARIEPYVSQQMRQNAKTLDDVPGGWQGYTMEVPIVGLSEPEPPEANVRTDPQALGWGTETTEATERKVTIIVENRKVDIGEIIVFPSTDTISLVEGRHGTCSNRTLEATSKRNAECAMKLLWKPGQGTLVLNHELVIPWRETPKEGTRISDFRNETVVRMTGRGIFIDPHAGGVATIGIEPEVVDLNTTTKGQASTPRRIKMTVTGRPTVIETINVTPRANAAGLRATDTSECVRTHVPGEQTRVSWCFITLQIAADAPAGSFDDKAIEVIWAHARSEDHGRAKDRYISEFNATWEVKDESAPRTQVIAEGMLEASHTAIDFGTVKEGRYEQRITLTNTRTEPSELQILRASVESTSLDARKGSSVDAVGCTGLDSGKLESNDFCDVRVTWKAEQAATLDARVEVVWETSKGRHRLEIPLNGAIEKDTLKAPPDIPSTQAQAPRTMSRKELARERARATAARPALGGGIGVVEMSMETLRALDPANARRLRIIDQDLSSIGVQWSDSSRPVDLGTVIIENVPIHIVVTHRVNAAFGGPVTAMVQRPVWGGHKRAQIIERGSRVVGYTRGVTGFSTGSGTAQEEESEQGGQPSLQAGARLDVEWRYLMRPDGSAFNVEGELATGDLMGQRGLPVILDPYEWERYIAMVGNAGLRALAILASPQKQLVKTIITAENGETREGFEHIPTNKELAAREIVDSVRDVSVVMQMLTTPQPSVVLPAGTRGVLSPTRGLRLIPITEVPIERATVPGSAEAAELANEIERQSRGLETAGAPSPEQAATQEDTAKNEQEQGHLEDFQRPPAGFDAAANRAQGPTADQPSWLGQAQQAGVTTMEDTDPRPAPREAPLPTPRRRATTQPDWATQ